jgi:hypothetical protein
MSLSFSIASRHVGSVYVGGFISNDFKDRVVYVGAHYAKSARKCNTAVAFIHDFHVAFLAKPAPE